MVYKIPKSEARNPENQFEFEDQHGRKYHVPYLQFLPPKLIVSLGNPDQDQEIEAVEKILSYYSTDDMDLVGIFDDGKQMVDWLEAWEESSTASMGESPASEASSEGTGAH
ncbi:hypothetical protein [Bifidobacterium sp. ESL0790]|uniref:hypothetical protein n=1 Tax=Bifidobacterium sp. ESL0790 TaxID=2983233 RepID=UPI0023F985EF|nr:hypothetical protein [Bifidobacterium sp. ESL0790]WEV72152.1 hypothetical protein OZY47_06845 [Bifidobacterium sp. ESL0790]